MLMEHMNSVNYYMILRNNEKFIFISDNVDYTCIIELDELKDDIPIFKYVSDCFKIFGIFSKS